MLGQPDNTPSFHMSTCTKFKEMLCTKHNVNSWYTTYRFYQNSTKSSRKTIKIGMTSTTKKTTDRQEQE